MTVRKRVNSGSPFEPKIGFSRAVRVVHEEFFGNAAPAATAVAVVGFLDPRWKVEIEADAIVA